MIHTISLMLNVHVGDHSTRHTELEPSFVPNLSFPSLADPSTQTDHIICGNQSLCPVVALVYEITTRSKEEWGERETDVRGSDARRRRRTNRRTSVFTSTPTGAPLEDRCTQTQSHRRTSAHRMHTCTCRRAFLVARHYTVVK